MSEPLRGKVAQIVNQRELVITLGSNHGVKEGMHFAVLTPKGADISDPDTGENIGSIDLPKVLVEATRVQPRLSVARTFRTRRRNLGGSGTLGTLFQPPKWVEETESLRLSDSPSLEDLNEEDSYVKIGDPVVEVRGEEFTLE